MGKRALGVIRLSKTADPASTSLERQREIIEDYTRREGIELVGIAEDTATSAFHIPPEKRRAIREWFAREGDFDCIVYWRQDRLVRRAQDFMGMVSWCQTNGKALYSATEGMGDVTQSAGILVGFIKAWQSEQESVSTSARMIDSQAKLKELGRWRGGRPPYGFRAECMCHHKPHCPDKWAVQPYPGYHLVPDEKGTARIITEAARRVIAGESVHAVASSFNVRGIKSTDGKIWKQFVLRKALRNTALMDGILNPAEFSQLQQALDLRAVNRTVRTTGRDSVLLDIVFCGRCGGKIYRWKRDEIVYGRCRNHALRGETVKPCNLPQMHYDMLEEMVYSMFMEEHEDDEIEERITDATRQMRIDEIDRDLIRLAGEQAEGRVTREEFRLRQDVLLDEKDALKDADNAVEWRGTRELAKSRWDRLSEAERRLWLIRIGITYSVDRVNGAWVLESSPQRNDAKLRERFVRVA